MNLVKESKEEEDTDVYFGDGLSDLVDLMLKRKELTPDYPNLVKQHRHKVFVYGSLMYGLGNNHILNNSALLGDAATVRNDFDMISFGGFPGLLKCKKGLGNYIIGELYSVSLDVLERIDHLESNGSFYKRELVKVKNTKDKILHTAWVYTLIVHDPTNYGNLPAVEEYDKVQMWWTCEGSWAPVHH